MIAKRPFSITSFLPYNRLKLGQLGFSKTFDNYRVELCLFGLVVTSRVHLSFLRSTQIANRKIVVSLSQLHLCSCRLHTWRILLLHVLFVYLLQVWYLELFLTLQTLHLLLEAHCVPLLTYRIEGIHISDIDISTYSENSLLRTCLLQKPYS